MLGQTRLSLNLSIKGVKNLTVGERQEEIVHEKDRHWRRMDEC